MNSIDYFSPEELAAMRQNGSARGIGAASATPEPAAPVAEPAAPAVATPATSSPTIGQRILNARNTASRVLKFVPRGAGAVQEAVGAYDTIKNGASSSSIGNLFNGLATTLNPAAGVAGDVLTGLRDTFLSHVINSRSVGPNNVGPELQKQIDQAGGLDTLLKNQQAARSTPEEPEVPKLTSIPDGVPANGTGYIQNEDTGNVTRVGAPSNVRSVRRQVQVDVGGTTPASLQQTPTGGIFSTLIGPQLDQARAVGLGSALNTREYKRQQAQQAQDLDSDYKRGTLKTNERIAGAHEISALASLRAASVKENPTKIVQDALGNPIIVNPANGTAVKPSVQQNPTFEEFMKQAKGVNAHATDAQLKAYYDKKYGGQ